MMNTNLFSFIPPEWEYDAGVFFRIAAVLVFQRALRRYYISNAASYHELFSMNFFSHHVDLAETADSIIMPLLSPEGLEILCDGAQRSRTEKTKLISENKYAQKYLNVCVTSDFTEARNCCVCTKCKRTLFALESAGVLEKFAGVFDLSKWKKEEFRYKCECVKKYAVDSYAKDNVDFARKNGVKLPSKTTAGAVCLFFRFSHMAKTAVLHPGKIIRKIFRRRKTA